MVERLECFRLPILLVQMTFVRFLCLRKENETWFTNYKQPQDIKNSLKQYLL